MLPPSHYWKLCNIHLKFHLEQYFKTFSIIHNSVFIGTSRKFKQDRYFNKIYLLKKVKHSRSFSIHYMVYLMLSILEFRGLGYTNLYGWVNPNPFTFKLSYFGFWQWKFQYIYYLVVVQIDSWVLLGNIPQCNSGLLSLWSRGRPRSWLRHWITFFNSSFDKGNLSGPVIYDRNGHYAFRIVERRYFFEVRPFCTLCATYSYLFYKNTL